MNRIIGLLTILTCILFYFLGQRSVVNTASIPQPKCDTRQYTGKVYTLHSGQTLVIKEQPSCVLRTRRDCKPLDHDLPLNQK